MNQTEKRKQEHIEIALKENVRAHCNYWDRIKLIHNALPEINKEDIDLSTSLLGKRLKAPIVIEGMTGGYKGAKRINENLAKVAERFQIAMGVGSQRSALENREMEETYSIVKDYDIPLRIANIGASQIVKWSIRESLDNLSRIVDMIDAHALAICLNFLQETIQLEGETNARGCLEAIRRIAEEMDIPIIVKETGAGISYEVALKLARTKIACIDIGGAGGTSFAAIEHYRAKLAGDWLHERGGKTFWDWGIPAPISLIEVLMAVGGRMPVIASGGIRNGLDAARAVAMGASAVGMAYAMLKPAVEGEERAVEEMDAIIKELRAAMFLVGASNLKEMSKVGFVWI